MPLKYLIDEHLRGKFARALLERGFAEGAPVDVLEVGGVGAPPAGTADSSLLQWACENHRVLVSLDRSTLPECLALRLREGKTSPGILFIRRGHSWDQITFFLVLYAEAAPPEECENTCIHIPP